MMGPLLDDFFVNNMGYVFITRYIECAYAGPFQPTAKLRCFSRVAGMCPPTMCNRVGDHNYAVLINIAITLVTVVLTSWRCVGVMHALSKVRQVSLPKHVLVAGHA